MGLVLENALNLFFTFFTESDIRNTSKQNVSAAVTASRILQEAKPSPVETSEVKVISKTCNPRSELSDYHRFAPITSNLSDWTYNKRRICPVLKIEGRKSTTRQKFVIFCENGFAYKTLTPTNSSADIQHFNPGDNCLYRFVNQCCSSTLPVPNVVHYVLYNKKELTFFEFVSFISVLRFVRPCVIMIHGNSVPSGLYWNFIINLYPNIVHVYRDVKPTLFDQKVTFIEHFSDVWRVKALLRFGGIYLDADTLLVKQIETLRRFPCTMSRQNSNKTIGSAFIMAERNATFIRAWFDWYKFYYVNSSYTYNAMMYPSYLANRKPGLIHIEYGTIARPDGQRRATVYNTNTNWSNIYGMHLFVKSYRSYSKYIDENNVKNFNSTVGAICRHILFGNKELCSSSAY